MGTSFRKVFLPILNTLPWEDFQVLCLFYLRDLGYSASLGQIPGRDDKHDIYGYTKEGQPFIAHVTTKNIVHQRDVKEEIISGVNRCISVPKNKSEILYFSRNKIINSPIDETIFIEDLLNNLISLDSRIQDNPPRIRLITGNKLINEICNFGDSSISFRTLMNRFVTYLNFSIKEDEDYFEDDDPLHINYSEEDLLRWLSDYSEILPLDVGQAILHNIITCAWNIIYFKPLFAINLLEDHEILNKSHISKLLIPLCKASIRSPLLDEEIISYIKYLRDEIHFISHQSINACNTIIIKMIKHLIYNQPDIFMSNKMIDEIDNFKKKAEVFWDAFFVDLYYIISCRSISADTRLLSIIESACERYKKIKPQKPLSRLWNMIISPLDFYQITKFEEFLVIIEEIASQCQMIIECKWCIIALIYILPIYDTTEDDLEYSDVIENTINTFNRSLFLQSSSIQSFYLRNLLRSFYKTKKIDYLIKYEKEFMNLCNNMKSPQISELQLEYASALYICFQFKELAELNRLLFLNIVILGKNIIEHKLFRNNYFQVIIDLKKKPSLNDKGSIFNFLLKYLEMHCSLYAGLIIRQNHLKSINFRLLHEIFPIRKLIGNFVLSSLFNYIKLKYDYAPSFYARSTRSFQYIPMGKYIDIVREYTLRGLKSDEYTLIRNAKYLTKSLFYCFYYGNPEWRNDIEESIKFFLSVTNKKKILVPKMYLAYIAGIKYKNSRTEKEFINEIYSIFKKSSKKIYQLALRRSESVIIPGEIIERIKEKSNLYDKNHTFFAIALSNQMNNPEIYNVIGTTIQNNYQNDRNDYEKSALFYSIAKCLARSSLTYDQKYCFNYIKCKSIIYLDKKYLQDDFFIIDTIRYLRRRDVSYFSYKEECTKEYWQLIEIVWNKLSMSSRTQIKESYDIAEWIRNCVDKMKLFEYLNKMP